MRGRERKREGSEEREREIAEDERECEEGEKLVITEKREIVCNQERGGT